MDQLQAVILAAGDGGRLLPHTAELPKPLLTVAARPIISRVLDALFAAGVRDTTLVVGYRSDQMREALAQLAPCGMSIHFVENDAFELGNARSLWAARDSVTGGFVLAMADHLLAPEVLASLIAGAGDRCRLAVECVSADDSRADEATRALVCNGRVVDLGKGIAEWNALDTGLFWCTPRVFDAITPELRDGEAGAVFASLARAGELDAVDVTGSAWIDIDTEDDLREATLLTAHGEIDGATEARGRLA